MESTLRQVGSKSKMSRRKVSVRCRYCNAEFSTTLRWEGLPEKEYCSSECELNDQFSEYDEDTFEKFSRGGKEEWH